MGRKLGGSYPFFGEEGAGSPSNTVARGRGLPPYQVASRSIQPFGRNGYGPKIGGLCPFGGGGAGSPSNTMWPGPMPTCMPSFILIRQTVWPQYTNVSDRQTDRQDRQRSDSIGEPFYKRSPKKQFNYNCFKYYIVIVNISVLYCPSLESCIS